MARGIRLSAVNQTKPYVIEILNYDDSYSRCVNPQVNDGVLTASIGGSLWGATNHLIIQFSVSDESILTFTSSISSDFNTQYYVVDSNGTVKYNSASAGSVTLTAETYNLYLSYHKSNTNNVGQHGITVRKK